MYKHTHSSMMEAYSSLSVSGQSSSSLSRDPYNDEVLPVEMCIEFPLLALL